MHPDVPQIDLDGAKSLLDSDSAVFVDIRDPASHAAAHIPGATHITSQQDLDAFCSGTEKDAEIVVYCYHGNSSKGATLYLAEQGFKNAKSMAGGFEAWRVRYPDA